MDNVFVLLKVGIFDSETYLLFFFFKLETQRPNITQALGQMYRKTKWTHKRVSGL